ncbi:MAG: nuclear transport factor 2 family protein [Chitinophagaceae bacterium]|nr:nuclear transport factor 2 family protein [Chitinophagaceae bacterium]
MKVILFIVTFFVLGSNIFAQADSITLKEAIARLNKALIEKDAEVLKAVLHKDASFGHSSGWAQTKEDVLNDFKSGKLVYHKIENSNISLVAVNKKWATVRTNTHAEGTNGGNAFNLNLHVLQVWVKTKKGWQLAARQSAKL